MCGYSASEKGFIVKEHCEDELGVLKMIDVRSLYPEIDRSCNGKDHVTEGLPSVTHEVPMTLKLLKPR